MSTKGYILDHDSTNNDNVRYNDMQGQVATAPTGASAWLTAQIGATGFFINWLQAGQDDFFQNIFQMSHTKALGTNIKSFHIHYLLSTAPAAGNTVILDYAYTWVNKDAAVPVIGSWTSGTKTITFAGTETALTHYITGIVSDITPPANETYSSLLLFKVTRNSLGVGADTYAGNFGLLYSDCHFETNRLGSVNEFTD